MFFFVGGEKEGRKKSMEIFIVHSASACHTIKKRTRSVFEMSVYNSVVKVNPKLI